MRDVLPDIDQWLARGKSLALATVIQTWGSAPRRVGAHMAISESGEIAGSVSGGCVEGAVVDAGLKALSNEKPNLLHFGVADETAWEVGLACGGEIEVFVEPLNQDAYSVLHKALLAEESVVSGTVVRGAEDLVGKQIALAGVNGEEKFSNLGNALEKTALPHLRAAMEKGKAGLVELEKPGSQEGPIDLFINPLPPSPKLVVIGGVQIAIALCKMAKTLGFQTLVIDPRQAFGNQTRFPEVDQLLQAWPEEALKNIELNSSTAVVTLSHDPKIDNPALIAALKSRVAYIGALGSRKTHEKRIARLKKAGLSNAKIGTIRAPIGLDIGATNPEEIALAIMAEIVATVNKSEI